MLGNHGAFGAVDIVILTAEAWGQVQMEYYHFLPTMPQCSFT
jgi:hypothetical protein